MQRAVVYDVDGTLADVSGVRHYVTDDPRRKDFHSFHAAASYVQPHFDVVRAARWTASAGLANLVVTSRKEMWRYRTSTWLQKWEVPFEVLLMRPNADDRRDREVKADILAKIRTRYEVVLAFDDNPQVIQLWRDEGIPVVRVPGWIHD